MLNSRCYSAPCIVLPILCFLLSCILIVYEEAQSINIIHPHVSSSSTPILPRGPRNSTSLGGAIIETSLLPIHAVNTMGQIPLWYGLYREHRRTSDIKRYASTSKVHLQMILCALQKLSWKLLLSKVSFKVAVRPTFHKNRMFLFDSLFPLRCCTPHLISQLTAGWIQAHRLLKCCVSSLIL